MALTLLAARVGCALPETYLGHVLTVPPEPTEAELGRLGLTEEAVVAASERGDDALFELLGAHHALPGVGRPGELRAHGMVAPSPWEQRWLGWVATRLGVPLVHPGSEPGPLAGFGQLASNPAARWPDCPPAGLNLVVGESFELEARAVARSIRAAMIEMEPSEWPTFLDGVTIVLPPGGARSATWRRILEELEVPVVNAAWGPVVDTSVGRWAVALCRLAGWEGQAADRDLLRATLSSPHTRLLVGERRKYLVTALRSLRRPAVSFEGWMAHLRASFAATREEERRWSREDAARTETLSAQLGEIDAAEAALGERMARFARALARPGDADFFERLHELLSTRLEAGGLGMSSSRGKIGHPAASAAVLAAMAELGAQGEALAPAVSGAGPGVRRSLQLREALEGRAVLDASGRTSGVRLRTGTTWDGSANRWIVVVGLEEGGWLRAPQARSRVDERLATAVGLGASVDGVERESLRIAAMIASATDRVTLSWSTVDDQGRGTFAGAALTGLPADERDPRLAAWKAITTNLGARAAVTVQAESALTAAELAAVDPALVVATGVAEAATVAQATTAARNRFALLRAERAPAAPVAAIGPWTGLVGVPMLNESYSPTSLESFGACGTQYFLGRVLRLVEADDAGSDLSATELGSLLHLALARVAWAAVETGAPWDSTDPAAVESVVQKAVAKIQGEVEEFIHAQPTFSRAAAGTVVARWGRALREYLSKQAAAGKPPSVATGLRPPSAQDLAVEELEALSATPGLTKDDRGKLLKISESVAARRSAEAAFERVLPLGGHFGPGVKKQRNEWYDANKASLSPLGKGALVEALASASAQEASATLLAPFTAELGRRRKAAEPTVEKAWKLRWAHVGGTVAAAEWSFGPHKQDGTSDPQSIQEPVSLVLADGGEIKIHGQVDRVDFDADLQALSVIDYKSGRAKSDGRLLTELYRGTHLQLPLYAAAVRDGQARGRLQGNLVNAGRLAFVRTGKQAEIAMEPVGEVAVAEPDDGNTYSVDEVARAHLGWTLSRLESGEVPMVPRACPLRDKKEHCAFSSVCGFSAEAHGMFPSEQPQFAPAPRPKPDVPEKRAREAEPPGEATVAEPVAMQWAGFASPASPDDPPAALDDRQAARPELEDVSRDVVVAAGAGSGKTYALVQRYLAALRAGARPATILAVTFTRKATAEMRVRVREKVAAEAHPERGAWLRELGGAPIVTLDSLAGSVVLALDPAAAVAVHPGAARWESRWVESRLLRAVETGGDPDVTLLLQWLALPVLRESLVSLVRHRSPLGEEETTPAALVERWKLESGRARRLPELVSGLEELLAEAQARAASEPEAKPSWSLVATALAERLDALRRVGIMGIVAQGIAELPKPPKKDADQYRPFHARAIATLALAGNLASAKDALSKHLGGERDVHHLEERLLEEARVSLAALRLGARWQSELQTDRAAAGVYDYADVVDQALHLLAHTPAAEVAARLPYEHVFVDEFQDTNQQQVELVERLCARIEAGGRPRPKLFLVGDVKQSIYRFRGAEVDVFERELGKDGRLRLDLPVGRRSLPNLTRALDRLFQGVLAPADGAGRALDPLGAVSWEPLAPRKKDNKAEASADEADLPCVLMLRATEPAAGAGDARAEDAEAAAGPSGLTPDARDENDSSESGETPAEGESPEEDATTPVNPVAVAWLAEHVRRHRGGKLPSTVVLVNSWNRAARWGTELRVAGIPATVQGGRGLLGAPEVEALLSVARTLEDVDDPLPFVALLRGPLVGLSDPGLYCLRRGWGVTRTIDEVDVPAKDPTRLGGLRWGFRFDAAAAIAAMRVHEADLSPKVVAAVEGDAARIEALFAWLGPARQRWGIDPAAEVLGRVVVATGWAGVEPSDDSRRARVVNLRDFLSFCSALETTAATTGDMLRELSRLVEDEEDPAGTGGDIDGQEGVVVTVVHQAKGLQWDYVVVPELEKFPVRSRSDGFVPVRLPADAEGIVHTLPGGKFESRSDLFSGWSGVGGLLQAAASLPAERAENRRLFYVAATRAKNRLVLGASWPVGADATTRFVTGLERHSAKQPFGAPHARNWHEHLAVSLGASFGPEGEVTFGGWKEGQDFAWVSPALAHVAATPVATSTVIEPARAQRVCTAPVSPEVEVQLPSGKSGSTSAEARKAVPGDTQPTRDLPPSPFGKDYRREGLVVHRVLELAAWATPSPDVVSLAAVATREVLGAGDGSSTQADRSARCAAWVADLVGGLPASNPDLVARLRAAAVRGTLWHEVTIGWTEAGPLLTTGSIDLLWQDPDGSYHLLDYKASEAKDDEAGPAESLRRKAAHYHPQVALYAEGVARLLPDGARIATYGLWFVKEGVVVTWAT